MKDKNIQYRDFPIDKENFRAFNEDDSKVLEGYAAKWGVRSKLLRAGGEYFYEVLEREAFAKPEIINGDTTYNKDHNDEYILARTEAGTLVLEADEIGLKFRAVLTEGVSYADNLYKNVESGNIKANSFAFIASEEDYRWEFDEDIPVGYLQNIRRLLDVSSVVRPAYPETTLEAREVAIRSCESFIASQNDDSSTESDILKLEEESRKRKIKLKN